jgi:hypothetical protein
MHQLNEQPEGVSCLKGSGRSRPEGDAASKIQITMEAA